MQRDWLISTGLVAAEIFEVAKFLPQRRFGSMHKEISKTTVNQRKSVVSFAPWNDLLSSISARNTRS
jgi:hypothetical protein